MQRFCPAVEEHQALVLAEGPWLSFSVASKGGMALNHGVTLLLARCQVPPWEWLLSCVILKSIVQRHLRFCPVLPCRPIAVMETGFGLASVSTLL